jgi:hypothetical protein
VIVGIAAGCLAAGLLILALARFWVPDSLHNPVSLMLMFVAFTAANLAQEEAGLLAVTVMGICLANQKWVSIRHVVEFKENLTVLLISWLFILLSARLQPADLFGLNWHSAAFVAVMIVVARPLSVLAATWGSQLSWPERTFLCCMAPRGIVAAAISSVFALNLAAAGHPQAIEMAPITFLVVFVTVLVYGLSAGPLARRLGLIQANPQGLLFVGAEPWTRALAQTLHQEGCPVCLIDTDWENIQRTRMAGLPCLYGSALAEATREAIDYNGLGRMLAVTANNEVNSLACLRYAEDFGRQEVYQLPLSSAKEGKHEDVAQDHRGRLLFCPELTFANLCVALGRRPIIKKTKLTAEFDFKAFEEQHAGAALPLFILKSDGAVQVRTVNESFDPKAGDQVISAILEKPLDKVATGDND